MPTIHVTDRDGAQHQVELKPGASLMEVLRDNEMGVAALCGGVCCCGTCHVYVDANWRARLPEAQSDETDMVRDLPSRRDHSRLSCQIKLHAELDGLAVTVAPED